MLRKKNLRCATAKEIVVYFREPNIPFIRDPFVIQILISNTTHTPPKKKQKKYVERKAANLLAQK